MREILFRGKTDKGEWVEGFYGQFHNRPTINEPNIHQIFVLFTEEEEKENEGHIFSEIGGIWHTVIPETVGQYTGLTDKNGTKIFEGDIISISGDFKGIYTCVWEEYHFDYELENKTMRCCLACVYSDDIKVIGNIHDNPELLKGGAE